MTTVVNMNLSEINQYENNPRNNDAAVDKVAESIKEFGFKVPIIVDKDNIIIAGHTRYKAAVKLGLEIVPVIKADDLTEQQVKAFRIMDNKSSEFATWNYEALLKEMESLKLDDYNLDLTGFDLSEMEQLEDKYNPKEIQEDEDFDIEEQLENIEEPKSKKGDIWLLGKNRLMCGDSTVKEDIEKLMNGQKAKLVFTDPPYNVNYEGATADKLTIENDNMSQDEFYEFLSKVFNNYYENMEEGAPIYVCHADSEGENFRRTFREAGLKLAQCIIWVKNAFVMGRQDYQWRHEPILYGWKEGKAHYFVDDRTQDTVWEIPKPNRNAEHPTMKPLALCARAIKNSSKQNDLVIDFFGGSGSTLMAATELNRICYTIELDEKYADVIALRYINKYGSDEVYLLRDGKKIPYLEV
ncbi:DNA modification methylase [Clostridium beijerinckii]|uniref:DNA modification methylase n=1 Tax=Clostridium beijerinckii TaxID=1520 RepID=UPI00156E25BF|nr:DNA modification methylase [Clostridium beijerinckii]NRT34024.1 DNA modification methylase [Clostridium beijerinckii]NRT46546.1 DNA modification methylase [Clostridium beijerinckii]NRZ19449.1 DNA modification methylase [Clostridium beijerinckii]